MRIHILISIFLMFVGLIGFVPSAHAQRTLSFINIADHRVVEIEPSDLVKFEYNGYLKQEESCYGLVVDMRDSIISIHTLDKKYGGFRNIHVKDISGFRKFRKARLVLEPLVSVGVGVSSIILFYWLGKNYPNIGFGTRLGISFGVTALSTGLTKVIFYKRIRNEVAHGWIYSIK